MAFFELIVVAIGLSMDAATVTTCNMLAYGKSCGKKKWLFPLAFGVFQGIMPLLGSMLGYLLSDFISRYSSIVMFVIFAVIGGKMIWDGIRQCDDDSEPQSLKLSVILIQALATSIDAFAVGVGFAASGVNIWTSSGIIAATTFLICAGCLFLGEQMAKLLKSKASLAGGIIVLFIAILSLF